ncbi:MAG: MraY family glycosyltransferase [Pseudomonadota bacterium]
MVQYLTLNVLSDLFTCTIAFFVTILSIQILRPLALRVGLVDRPGGRKNHNHNVPLVGGIAMFVGISFALLSINYSLLPWRSFIAAIALLIITGILDDFHELTAKVRFLAQIFAGGLMVIWGKNYIVDFGNLLFLGNIHLGYLGMPITIFAVVGVINAMNMLDGIDGLAGCIALVQLVILAILAFFVGNIVVTKLLLIVIAALFGFLIFNFQWPRYASLKVFMGDAGSMLLGFILVWFLVALSQGQHPAARPVTMLWIMILPLFDTLRVIIERIWKKTSPFKPARDHIHYRLLSRGYKFWQVNLILMFISLLSGVVAITAGFYHISAGIMFLAYILLFAIYFVQMNFSKLVSPINIQSES